MLVYLLKRFLLFVLLLSCLNVVAVLPSMNIMLPVIAILSVVKPSLADVPRQKTVSSKRENAELNLQACLLNWQRDLRSNYLLKLMLKDSERRAKKAEETQEVCETLLNSAIASSSRMDKGNLKKIEQSYDKYRKRTDENFKKCQSRLYKKSTKCAELKKEKKQCYDKLKNKRKSYQRKRG